MTQLRNSIVFTLALTVAWVAHAGPDADSLGRCLTDNTSGKERKELARWMFVAMSAHAEMKSLSSTTQADMEQASRSTGLLFTKLLSESCPVQAKSALQSEGPRAMQIAFSTLGQVAMQELMVDPNVNNAISLFQKYVDQKKVEAALGK